MFFKCAILMIVLLACACDASQRNDATNRDDAPQRSDTSQRNDENHRNDAPQRSDESQRHDVTHQRNEASKRIYSGVPVLYHRPRLQERVWPQVPERRSKPFGWSDCEQWCAAYCVTTIAVWDPNSNECACKPFWLPVA